MQGNAWHAGGGKVRSVFISQSFAQLHWWTMLANLAYPIPTGLERLLRDSSSSGVNIAVMLTI